MKRLIVPPGDTELRFAVLLYNKPGCKPEADGHPERRNTAAEALAQARDLAAAGAHCRVFEEIAFTIDPDGLHYPEDRAGGHPDMRDVLIRKLLGVLNTAAIELIEDRMPSLIEIAEVMKEAKACGFTISK